MEENFYIWGDGICVYFFEKDEFVDVWLGKLNIEVIDGDVDVSFEGVKFKFEIEEFGVDCRMFVNCVRKFKMYWCWM